MAQIASEMRVGWIISNNGRKYSVLSTKKVKPGKQGGGAYILADLRDLETGNKTNERWRSEDKVEKLQTEDVSCQFLYDDGTAAMFMRMDDYEQFNLPLEDIGEQSKFLQPDMKVVVNFIEGNPASVTIPKTVIATIAETEPALRGQTASGSGKPAVLDNGVRITVPTFIEVGEKIVVNTETLEYNERAK
jgi:elongation factor P